MNLVNCHLFVTITIFIISKNYKVIIMSIVTLRQLSERPIINSANMSVGYISAQY